MLTNVSDLDIRLIRVFLAVVDARGISVAQSSLNVGQSTLSAQLATLEVRLGYRLCERGRGGFRLTPKGERFERLARQFLATASGFCREVRNIDRQLVGTLAIGLIDRAPPIQHVRLSQALDRFKDRDESVQFTIVQRSPEQIEREILSGALDLAIGYCWHRVPSLAYVPLFVEEQFAYCGRGHPLFERAGSLSAQDVSEHEWVGRSYPVPELAAGPKIGDIFAVADNMEAAAILVLSGRYLGFLPPAVAEPYMALGLMRLANPTELKYHAPVHVVRQRAAAKRSESAEAFFEDLRSVYLEPATPLEHGTVVRGEWAGSDLISVAP